PKRRQPAITTAPPPRSSSQSPEAGPLRRFRSVATHREAKSPPCGNSAESRREYE
ncbi:Hypothetical predicted protein, partial [Podarcis lilfordi]